jgi:hypothetical protein
VVVAEAAEVLVRELAGSMVQAGALVIEERNVSRKSDFKGGCRFDSCIHPDTG